MTDGAELILSKSSIETWLTCKYQWLLSYAYRIKGAPSVDMAVGTAVHAGVEAHWKGEDPVQATMTALLKESTMMLPEASIEALRAVPDAHRMVSVYLHNIAPTFIPTLVEADFLVRVNGTLLSGRIDAADGDVHDTKTTSTPSKVDAEKMRLGMTLYRWGYKALTGNLPGRLLLDVVARNGRWKQVEVEPDDRGLSEVVSHVAAGVNRGDFEPTGARSGACARCPYFQRQCRFGRLTSDG